MRLNLDLKEKCADKNWAHFLSCSPDPITNSETTNSHLIGSKIHDQFRIPNFGIGFWIRGARKIITYRAATVDFRQARQPFHKYCCRRATADGAAFYFEKSRQGRFLGCLTPRGGPDLESVSEVQSKIIF
jgi:hypothetical protein